MKQKAFATMMLLSISSVSSVFAQGSEILAATLRNQPRPAGLSNDVKVKDALDLAFHDGDLLGLRDFARSAGCTGPTVGLKASYSGQLAATKECFENEEHAFYRNFDLELRRNPAHRGQVSRSWDVVNTNQTVTDVMKNSMTRLGSRFAVKVGGANPLVRALVEGNVEWNFSLSSFTSESKPVTVESPRPVYILKIVQEKIPESRAKVAFAGDLGFLPLRRSPLAPPHAVEETREVSRQIIEEWPASQPKVTEPATAAVQQELSFAKEMQRNLGLSREPFQRYHLRVERTTVGLKQQIALKLREESDLLVLDFTNALAQKNRRAISWSLRIPYYRHSVTISAPTTSTSDGSLSYYWDLGNGSVTTLSYGIKAKNATLGLTYNL